MDICQSHRSRCQQKLYQKQGKVGRSSFRYSSTQPFPICKIKTEIERLPKSITLCSPSIQLSVKMSTNKLITLITGANQGIGYYAAQKLASTGKHIVLIGSRDLKKGQKAIEELALDTSASVNKADLDAVELDLDSDISITAAAEKVEKKYGRLDIVSRTLRKHPLSPMFSCTIIAKTIQSSSTTQPSAWEHLRTRKPLSVSNSKPSTIQTSSAKQFARTPSYHSFKNRMWKAVSVSSSSPRAQGR